MQSNTTDTASSLQEELNSLVERLKELQSSISPTSLSEECEKANVSGFSLGLRARRQLIFHQGKVYALNWATQDPEQLVTASQDSSIIIWNARTAAKKNRIQLHSPWVMTCCFSPNDRFVACGGLDNRCTLYRCDNRRFYMRKKNAGNTPAITNSNEADDMASTTSLAAHEGYVSCIRFMDDLHLISCSGDKKCIVWDLERKMPIQTIEEHSGDVMSVSISPLNPNVFVSGGCDYTCKIFDTRQDNPLIGSIAVHEGDVNCVDFMHESNCFVSGSDDGTSRLFDIRCFAELSVYFEENTMNSVTSVATSRNGNYIFCGTYNDSAYCWDTLTGRRIQELDHRNRVSCVGVSTDGNALATGSWDGTAKVWYP